MTEQTNIVTKAETTLSWLLGAALDNPSATQAMQYTQAAVNTAQVLMILHERNKQLPEVDELLVLGRPSEPR
jgi:hypothetical protein